MLIKLQRKFYYFFESTSPRAYPRKDNERQRRSRVIEEIPRTRQNKKKPTFFSITKFVFNKNYVRHIETSTYKKWLKKIFSHFIV